MSWSGSGGTLKRGMPRAAPCRAPEGPGASARMRYWSAVAESLKRLWNWTQQK